MDFFVSTFHKLLIRLSISCATCCTNPISCEVHYWSHWIGIQWVLPRVMHAPDPTKLNRRYAEIGAHTKTIDLTLCVAVTSYSWVSGRISAFLLGGIDSSTSAKWYDVWGVGSRTVRSRQVAYMHHCGSSGRSKPTSTPWGWPKLFQWRFTMNRATQVARWCIIFLFFLRGSDGR